MITQERIKELLEYNPGTGEITRLIAVSQNTKSGDIAGGINPSGYRIIRIDGKLYRAHRVAWFMTHGVWPKELDHINHKRSDNRLINLRSVTRAENCKNMSKSKRNTSGTTGVCWHARDEKYTANIRIDGELKHLGYFDTKAKAIKARRLADIEYAFHSNHGL